MVINVCYILCNSRPSWLNRPNNSTMYHGTCKQYRNDKFCFSHSYFQAIPIVKNVTHTNFITASIKKPS